MTFEQLLAAEPYSLAQPRKENLLLPHFNELTEYHRQHCGAYERLLAVIYPEAGTAKALAEIPFLPVGLFKTHSLASVPSGEIYKTLTSSGTTGEPSRVPLDRETARRQITALSRIMAHVLGPKPLPMILVDCQSLIEDPRRLNARAAGVLGMKTFGRHHVYLLDEQMSLNEPALRRFLEAYGGAPFLIFGFTFMVWQYFFEKIAGLGLDLSQGILIHSGGWKKVADLQVSNEKFRASLREKTGLTRIYNFYGMAEQVGSVYLEGEDGYLYPPNFADVIVRDPVNFREQPVGEPGLLQVLSLLPLSYPGHSLLTEDWGVVHGIDDSKCGRAGKYFSVLGRVPKAEARGCSDVY